MPETTQHNSLLAHPAGTRRTAKKTRKAMRAAKASGGASGRSACGKTPTMPASLFPSLSGADCGSCASRRMKSPCLVPLPCQCATG